MLVLSSTVFLLVARPTSRSRKTNSVVEKEGMEEGRLFWVGTLGRERAPAGQAWSLSRFAVETKTNHQNETKSRKRNKRKNYVSGFQGTKKGFSRSVVCEVSLARKVEHPGETVKALSRRAYGVWWLWLPMRWRDCFWSAESVEGGDPTKNSFDNDAKHPAKKELSGEVITPPCRLSDVASSNDPSLGSILARR